MGKREQMNVCVVDKQTNELLAFVSDKKECIEHDTISIVNYGDNEPIFESKDGKIFVVGNAWLTHLKA